MSATSAANHCASQGQAYLPVSLLECLVKLYPEGCCRRRRRERGMFPGSEGPIKITALKLIFTARPVSAEQKPVKRRFSSAESITSRDLKMCLSSVLIEHTRSMNTKLFGCEIISTKLVMFNLTVEWRFSNLGLNLSEEWRAGKLNSKFDLLMVSHGCREEKADACFPTSACGHQRWAPQSPAPSSALHQGRANHTYCMVPEPKRCQKG